MRFNVQLTMNTIVRGAPLGQLYHLTFGLRFFQYPEGSGLEPAEILKFRNPPPPSNDNRPESDLEKTGSETTGGPDEPSRIADKDARESGENSTHGADESEQASSKSRTGPNKIANAKDPNFVEWYSPDDLDNQSHELINRQAGVHKVSALHLDLFK